MPSSDFYFVENLNYDEHNGVQIKCELFEVDRNHYHPSDYKKHIYSFNRNEKKYNLLLESTIKIRVVPTNRDAHECESTRSYSKWVLLNSVFSIFGLYFLVRYVIDKISKLKKRSVTFSPYKFEMIKRAGDDKDLDLAKVEISNPTLNPVSSLELLRKKSKFKSVISHVVQLFT